MDFFDTFNLDGGVALGTLFITLIALAGNWRLFVKCCNNFRQKRGFNIVAGHYPKGSIAGSGVKRA